MSIRYKPFSFNLWTCTVSIYFGWNGLFGSYSSTKYLVISWSNLTWPFASVASDQLTIFSAWCNTGYGLTSFLSAGVKDSKSTTGKSICIKALDVCNSSHKAVLKNEIRLLLSDPISYNIHCFA